MSTREYIGARYVPVFANPLDWNASNTYEPLTVVLHQGNSFTSVRAVPAGIDISNTSYWAQTGNYNAQIEQYRQEVQSLLPAVPVSKGGTGATTAADALVALGAAESGGSTNTLYDAEQAIAENAADIADNAAAISALRNSMSFDHITNVRFDQISADRYGSIKFTGTNGVYVISFASSGIIVMNQSGSVVHRVSWIS